MKKANAEDYRKVDHMLRRLRRLIDKHKIDDPSINHAMHNIQERFSAGLLDRRMMAELKRLQLVLRDFLQRLDD